MAHKILAGGTLTDPGALSGLIDVAQKSLVIDSGWDLLGFAQQASDIAAGNLQFLTIPTRGTQTNDRGDVVLVDPSAVHDFVQQRIDAQSAAAAPTAAPEPKKTLPAAPVAMPDDVVPERYLVDVRNGSGTSGLAGTIAAHLSGLGFAQGTVDNAGATTTSVVRYNGSDSDAASAVADQLGGIDTQSGSDVTPGRLVVIIGTDFAAPAAAGPAAPPAPGGAITAAGVPCID